MATPNYPGNSNHVPEEPGSGRPPIKKIEATAVERGPSVSEKFRGAFFGDSFSSVREHVIWDVAVPFVKEALVSILIETVERTFNGSGPANRAARNLVSGSRTSYTPYNRVVASTDHTERTPGRKLRNTDDSQARVVEFETRGEAEGLLETMRIYLEKFGIVSRYDMLDAVSITGNVTDHKYGWADLSTARVKRTHQGYYKLDLPDAQPIE